MTILIFRIIFNFILQVEQTIADLNGDGKADLAVGSGNSVSVLLGNGDGTFAAAVSYGSGGTEVRSVAAGDVNGDGKRDIVLGNGGASTVGVLLGHGDGTFAPAATYPVLGSPWFVAIADLDGDTKPDIVVADVFANIAYLPGNGNGTFAPAVTVNGGESPRHAVVADFNADGKVDIAVANGDFTVARKNYVAVVLNTCPAAPRRRAAKH